MENYRLSQKLQSIPQRSGFSSRKLPKRVIISYILDYVIIIALFIIFSIMNSIEPYHQHFSLKNYTLQYPYAVHERVPVTVLYFVAIIIPIAILVVYALIIDGIFSHEKSTISPNGSRMPSGSRYRFKERLWELNCAILGILMASVSAYVITGALKNATGKPRPDLIDRCRPQEGSADAPVFGLSNSSICTQTDHSILKDGFRSFPSGHSSSSFAGLFFLSLYLAGKLHVFDSRGEVWKSIIVLIPSLGAALVAVSRIMDARHHPFDVISGSLIGIVSAWFAYRQYFPPLSESWRKGRAYAIRSWATEPVGPGPDERERARDEGVEPLRTAPSVNDEEQPNIVLNSPHQSGDYSFDHRMHGAQSEPTAKPPPQRTGPSSSYTNEFNARNPSNPFSTSGEQRGRSTHIGGEWSAASSEDGADQYGHELQPYDAVTNRQAQEGQHYPSYSARVQDFGRDTSYRSPVRNASGALRPEQSIDREGAVSPISVGAVPAHPIHGDTADAMRDHPQNQMI